MSVPQPAPPGHTAEGGVLVGSDGARRTLVVYEDPQCPFCRRSEQAVGDLLRREVAAGAVAVEHRTRSFLGPESVRAAGALAAAAGAGRFDELRRELYAAQPPEHSGGFTADDLVVAGERVGLGDDPSYAAAVREGSWEEWARGSELAFAAQDPDGTPQAWLDGEQVDAELLYDPDRLGDLLRR